MIFAASRKDKVINRTEILTVSINTRKGFNQSGAPEGKRWAMNFLGEWTAPLMIRENHKGSPKDKVNKRCPVELKT